MKRFFGIFLIFVCHLGVITAQDTTCIETQRLGRIADSMAYYRQYYRYSIICDTALVSCRQWGKGLEAQNIELQIQRDAARKSVDMFVGQYNEQRMLAQQWEEKSLQLDKKIQKQKKTRNAIIGILGGVVVGLGTAFLVVTLL